MPDTSPYRIIRDLIENHKRTESKELDLRNLGIRHLPNDLWDCKEITRLKLSDNKIENLPSGIGQLKNLVSLDLSGNRLSSLPESFTKLTKIDSLNLSYNLFYDIPAEILSLTNLRHLYLDYNKLTGISHDVSKLQNLERIFLGSNHLSDLPDDITKLTKLAILDISNNNFKYLPSQATQVTSLRGLDLSKNELEFIPTEIGHLKNLYQLDFSFNLIRALPTEIVELRQLIFLNLTSNPLPIPASVLSKPNRPWAIIVYYLLLNRHTDIEKISHLRTLNLSECTLTSIPTGIGKLINLTQLDLSNNMLSSLPEDVSTLSNLVSLNLARNRFSTLPTGLSELSKLSELDVRDNPLNMPPEILSKTREPKSIFTYFSSLHKKPLNELKILIVGQGGVGKTSILRRALDNTFDPLENKTEGIGIRRQKLNSKNHYYTLNLWDFGGQEIMHATHQFFLTKRSLYLLVLDARLTQEENRVEYWLKIIQSFGGESPVLIVGNKIDQHPLDIDRTGLQKKYPNIVAILDVSAATGAGIEALKAEIAKQVDTLPHVRDLLPEIWFSLKSKLEDLGREKNFITQDEYLKLCKANGVNDETSQQTLIGFLHDLGVVLHFQDDPRLAALGILNPQWVTKGVYKILNSNELFQYRGTLTLPMLNNILNLPEYPSNRRLFIVDMMRKFELCYDIIPDKSFLIPDLLPKDEPFTGDWTGALAFQIHYNVLPSSIITRFIVRMHSFVHRTFWRSGAVLKRGENTALVKADTEDRKIYIWVSGNEDSRRDLLAMIRGEFDAIHKTMAKIEATEKVPLPEAPEADPVDLTFLQQAVNEGRESLTVQVGSRIIDLLVKEVLSQIEKEGKAPSPNFVVNVQGNVYGSIGNSNTVNFIQQKFEPIYEAIEASSRDATEKQDLVAEVDEIKDEVEKGDQANESFLSRRLRNLKKTAPDIAEVALATLANPAAGLGMIVQKVAKKIKEETK